MRVYRLENEAGDGPYGVKYWGPGKVAELICNAHQSPEKWPDLIHDFVLHDAPHVCEPPFFGPFAPCWSECREAIVPDWEDLRFAFPERILATKWFWGFMGRLRAAGWDVVEYDVPHEYVRVGQSGLQVIFDREHAVKVA